VEAGIIIITTDRTAGRKIVRAATSSQRHATPKKPWYSSQFQLFMELFLLNTCLFYHYSKLIDMIEWTD